LKPSPQQLRSNIIDKYQTASRHVGFGPALGGDVDGPVATAADAERLISKRPLFTLQAWDCAI
jgi:hypothetical protein